MANYLDAVLQYPSTPNEFAVFVGYRWANIQIADGEPHEDKLVGYINALEVFRPVSVPQVGFTRVNAVVPVTGRPSQRWIFSQDRWVTFDFNGQAGPTDAEAATLPAARPLSEWSALSDPAVAFTQVDASIPVPGEPTQLWVFFRDQFARIDVPGGDPTGSTVVEGAEHLSRWKPLAEAKFTRVDAVIPVPDQPGQFWVFSGQYWVRIIVHDDNPQHAELRNGPSLIEKSWKSLADL
ncbi:hypothetical protein [Kitasatospora purpeofusca]|uniref:hypothetical protein n=1 Tax=Kitasatospora purpeofusca TaxID=67352 RepID=UPI003864D496|nr:hypothetical protein OIP63_00050 [Kitasatospora purpeofusca]